MLRILAVLVCLQFLGCAAVVITQPLPPTDDPDIRDQLAGDWLLKPDNSGVLLRFDEEGLGHFAGLEWKDEKFQMLNGQLIVSATGNHNIFCMRTLEKDGWENEYHLLRYKIQDKGRGLILWISDYGFFADAVREGRLQGLVEEEKNSKKVTIQSPPDRLAEFLDAAAPAEAFRLEDPLYLVKISGE